MMLIRVNEVYLKGKRRWMDVLVLCMHGSMTTAEPSPYSCKSRDKRIPIQLYGTLAGLVLSLLGII